MVRQTGDEYDVAQMLTRVLGSSAMLLLFPGCSHFMSCMLHIVMLVCCQVHIPYSGHFVILGPSICLVCVACCCEMMRQSQSRMLHVHPLLMTGSVR